MRIAYPLLVAAVLTLPLYFGAPSLHLLQWPFFSQLGIIAALSIIWLATYLELLHMLGEFGKPEWQFIKGAVNPTSLLTYFKEEVFRK